MHAGRNLARRLRPGDIVCLSGELGSGKTTFVKGVARGLGIAGEKVNSPTFVLLNIYDGRCPLYHFDFYRLESSAEIQAVGCEEFLYGDGISLIEWADKMGTQLPAERLDVFFQHQGHKRRTLEFRSIGRRYGDLVKGFSRSSPDLRLS